MAKKIKTVRGADGYEYPITSYELVLDENGESLKDKLAAIGSGGGIVVPKVEPEELDMPKVFFYGSALPTTKDNVNLTMDYISNTDRFSSYIKLKCQGTSSMSYAKKNFTINMYSDEARETKLKKDFKGWGAQSKFCLKANWVDSTHTRNISGARIGYDMVASRPDSAFKQQLLTAPRYGLVDGFPIKVYFNGEFHGIYTWNIPKDGWMFNMSEDNPNHIVLCAEKNTDGNATAINSCQFRKLWDGGNDWSYEFGTASNTVKDSLNRCIGFVMDATDQEFHDNIGQYFDLYSLLDYYCFSYLVNHLDGLAKNMLMVTYDGAIWGASLYDMDSIYGVSWNGASFVAANYRCPEQYQEQFSRLWVRIEQCFGAELYARYLELRQGALSLSNIIKHVEEIYDVIPDRVFADEKARWTNIPQVANNTMTRFRNYMRDRASYVDAQMLEIGASVPCTGITLDQTSVELTNSNTTVTLVATVEPSNATDTITWSSNARNIATVNNGLVTAKANGSAVITATCGSQSATCNVTVSGMSEGGGDTGGDIPYTKVEYIQGDGSVYIDTGFMPNNNTSIEIQFEKTDYSSTKAVFGSGQYMSLTLGNSRALWNYPGNKDEMLSADFPLELGVPAIAKFARNEFYANGSLAHTFPEGEWQSDKNLGLFCQIRDSIIDRSNAKIYYCKIWDNDVLVRNFVPVLDNSSVPCLYDKVERKLYHNAASVGNFVAGNIVGGDTSYTDIDYIESSGTQYINTGIIPTTSTKIEFVADISFNKQWAHLFGTDNFMKAQWANKTTSISITKKGSQFTYPDLTLGKHTYVMDMTDTGYYITIDGINQGAGYASAPENIGSTTYPLLLLCGYKSDGSVEADYCGVGKIYSCKIYHEDTLVANMKPILTNSGTYGLLDTVNNTFYGSEVGSFTGGNEA